MGFYTVKPKAEARQLHSADFHNRYECQACPLRWQPERCRDLPAVGSLNPVVYCLGEAPGETEVRKRAPFVGKAGRALRLRIPDGWDDRIRWNNCVRTRPSENRTPTPSELEACRPSIVRDIERTKPEAIFGFGNIPLQWAAKQSGITHWTGRYMPIKVGTHTCWFFPIVHPSYVIRSRKGREPTKPTEYGSEIEFGFSQDVKRAFDLVDKLPPPKVHTRDDAFTGVDFDMRFNDNAVQRIIEFLESLYDENTIGLDYETNALRPYTEGAKILSVALSSKHGTLGIPLRHSQARWSPEQLAAVEKAYKHFLYHSNCRKVSHNLSFELEWTAHFYGSKALRAGRWGCSMVQAYVLDERQKRGGGGPGPQALTFLTQQYFGIDIKELSPVDRKALDKADLDHVLRYNAVDARYHRLLYLAQAQRVKDEGLQQVYRQHLRRIPTMVLTQRKGVPIDQEVSKRLFTKYHTRRTNVENKIAKLKIVSRFKSSTGDDYRPSANADIKIVLDKLLPADLTADLRDKKTGALLQVDEKTLAQVDHPIASMTIRWRKNNKIISTYIEPLMVAGTVAGVEVEQSPHIYPDGLVHPVMSTTRTVTSRTSAADPSVQTYPKRDGERKEVRGQVSGGIGTKVVSFDYAGIQARNVAMESEDAALVAAFKDRYDVHGDWCERIAKRRPSWIKEGVKQLATDKDLFKLYRNRAKNEFVFPSFFGAKPKSLAGYLGISEQDCERLHDDFWQAFPDIKGWHKRIAKFYRKHGYVTGLSGVRRRAPVSPNEMINAPIQADEVLIVCTAMNELSDLGEPQFQANMMIHDDLTFLWPTKDVDKNAEVVLKHMLNPPFEWAHIVPIGVEMLVGDNWYEQKPAGEYFSDTWNGKLHKPKS